MIDSSVVSNSPTDLPRDFPYTESRTSQAAYPQNFDSVPQMNDAFPLSSTFPKPTGTYSSSSPYLETSDAVAKTISRSGVRFPMTSSSPHQDHHHPYGIKYIGTNSRAFRPERSNFWTQWMPSTKTQERRGACFVFTVVMFIGFQYFSYAVLMLPPLFYSGPWGITYVVVFHGFFSLMLVAFIQTSITDPGAVPHNWGFYMGDEGKRRRYCKICHAWKPDRTHHCSACGRCVLNMDHHCPWVNNCIGFANRKFFIQLLCYALICLCFTIIHGTHFLLSNGSHLTPAHMIITRQTFMVYIKDISVFVCSVMTLLFAVLLGIPLIPFTKFHLTMIARNSSTIENMDTLNKVRGLYDLGTSRNLHQVLGPNWFLWWLPFHISYSKPVGDGVRWRQQYWRAVES